MKKTLLPFLFVITTVSFAQEFSGLDTAILRITQNSPFVGATILVAKGDSILHNKGYGYAHLDFKVPATDSTRYWAIGASSLTLGSIAMHLVEQGKFSLDDKISKHLENIPSSWDAITIKHLITLTSGIPDYHYLGDQYDAFSGLSLAQDEVMSRFIDLPLTIIPGSKFDWSISNFVILNRIMEKTSGKSYQQLLKEFIAPLGITSTACFEPNKSVKNLAQGYEINYATKDYYPKALSVLQYDPSTSLYSTTKDLFMIWRGMVNGKLISKKSFELMISREEATKNNSLPCGYLTFLRNIDQHETVLLQGGLRGFSGSWVYIPKLDATVIVLSNSIGEAGQDASLLSNQVTRHLLGLPSEKVDEMPPPPSYDNEVMSLDEMNRISGTYNLKMQIDNPDVMPGSFRYYRKRIRVFTEQNTLKIQVFGELPQTLFKQKDGTFRSSSDPYAVISFTFENGDANKPQLKATSFGMTSTAERIGDADVKTFHEGLIK